MSGYLVPIGYSALYIGLIAGLIFITGVMIKLAMDFTEAYRLYRDSKKENDLISLKMRKENLKATGTYLFSVVVIWLLCLGTDLLYLAYLLK